MNTEYAVGNIRIHFESQARRRWFVVLCYAVSLLLDLACCLFNPKLNPSVGRMTVTGAWVICTCGTAWVALLVVPSWLGGDVRSRRDERETHRLEQSFSRAYPILGYVIVALFFAGCFAGPNPITPLSPVVLRTILVPLPFILLMATLFLYMTLPVAILLWTEPNMDSA